MSFSFSNNSNGFIISKNKGTEVTGSTKKIHSYKTSENGTEITASMNRYLPNNESLDATSVLDDITPQSEEGQLKLFRSIAKTDAVGGPAIDLISGTAWSDGIVTGIKDKEVLYYYEASFNAINPHTYMIHATNSYLTDGKIVASLIYNSDKGHFTDMIPQDPMYLKFEPIPIRGFDPKINYKGNSEFKKFFQSNDPRDVLAKSRIPSDLAKKLAMGGNVPLEPLNTLYVPRITSPFDYLGTSMLWRILPFYAIEKALQNASISSARRRARSITHIMCGIQDYWEPTQQDLDAIGNLFMQSEEDPAGAYVVTRDGIQTSDVRPGNDFWKLSEEWDMLTSGKTRALGLSEALLSGDTSLAVAEQGMILFIEQVKNLRDELTNRVFYHKIFANIARAHGFVKKDKFESTAHAINRMDETYAQMTKDIQVTRTVTGGTQYVTKAGLTLEQAYDIAYQDLLIPEIMWKKQLNPAKDSSYFDMLASLEEKGIPISKSQWAAAGGLDINKQIDDMDHDIEIQKLIQDKLAKKPEDKKKGKDDEEGDDDLDWAGASTQVTGATGVADVFDSLVNSSGRKTFFGVGPNRLRKAAKAILSKNDLKVLNDTWNVKNILSSVFDGNLTKINASCYLLNRALITDVKIDKPFLTKVINRIAERIKDDDGSRLRGLMKERNYCYSEMAKHNKNNKLDIDLSRMKDNIDVNSLNLFSGI